MKILICAVLLAVMQAAPPVPRKAANSPAETSSRVQSDASNKKTQPSPPVAIIKSQPTESYQSDASDKGKQNTEHSVRITELPPVTIPSPKKDWADWGTWGFTFLLAMTSGLQVWLLCRTLIFIRRQAHEMKRQRVAMQEQTKHLETSVATAKRSIDLLVSKERPRISVSPLKNVDFRGDSHIFKSISYQIDCICPTTAFIVHAEVGAFLETARGLNPIRELYGIYDFEKVPQSVVLEREVTILEPFEDDMLNHFETGELVLVFCGRITYRGVHLAADERSYVTSFSWKWVVDEMAVTRDDSDVSQFMDTSQWEKGTPEENETT